MADAEIGALRVTLAMNAGEFTKGARDAESSLKSLGEKLAGVADRVTEWSFIVKAAMVGAVVLAVERLKSLTEHIEEVSKASRKLFIPVEELTSLGYAANQVAGVSIDSLGESFKTLGENMKKFAGDSEDEVGKAFTAIGVSVKDADDNIRPIKDVLLEVADRFSNFKDDADKAALAVKLFGSNGAELLPMLNLGSEGIRGMVSEANLLGQTIDSGTSKAVMTFHENLSALGKVFSGVGNKIAAEIMPRLAEFTSWLVELVKKFQVVDVVSNILITGMRAIVVAVGAARAALEGIWIVMSSGVRIAATAFELIPAAIELAMRRAVNLALTGMDGVVNAIVSGLAKIAGATDQFTGAALGEKISQALTIDTTKLGTEEAQARFDALSGQLQNLSAGMAQSVGQLAIGTVESSKAIMGGWSASFEDAAERIPAATAPIIEAVEKDKEAQAELNKKIHEGIQLAKQIETPYETVTRKLESLKAAYDAGKISAEAMGRAQTAAAWTAQNAYASLASNVMGSLGKLFENNKAIAVATALVNTYESVTKALASYPPPLSFVAAGAALVAGLAQVMNIKNTGKNSGGSGASAGDGGSSAMTASGGGGGGGGGGDGGATATPQMLTVRGLSAGQLFSGEQVRELASALIKFQKDGGEVVLA